MNHRAIRLQTNSIDKAIDYSILYLTLLCTSGFYFHSRILAYVVPFMSAIIAACMHGMRIKNRIMNITIILVINVAFSSLINGDAFRTAVLAIIAITTAAIVVSTYTEERYTALFVNLMYALCVTSIIVFIVALFAENIIRLFPRIYDGTQGAYFLGIAFVRLATRWVATRNQGIFWEPGVFQTFIVLAFVMEISKYGKNRKSRISAFIISLVTTMSTTGYVALFIVVVIWLLEINHYKRTKLLNFLISLFAVLGIAFFIYDMLPHGISNQTFDKLFDLLNGTSTNIAVSTRRNSIIYSLSSFVQSPLWGLGSKGLSMWHNVNEDGMNIMVFTPGNWLARYGVVFGSICIIGFTQIRDTLFNVKINKYILFVLLIVIISTEAYTTNSAILIWAFYGWTMSKRNKRINKMC